MKNMSCMCESMCGMAACWHAAICGWETRGVAVHISCCVCQTGIGGEGWVATAQMKEGEGDANGK